jgi:hypothetical protein
MEQGVTIGAIARICSMTDIANLERRLAAEIWFSPPRVTPERSF